MRLACYIVLERWNGQLGAKFPFRKPYFPITKRALDLSRALTILVRMRETPLSNDIVRSTGLWWWRSTIGWRAHG